MNSAVSTRDVVYRSGRRLAQLLAKAGATVVAAPSEGYFELDVELADVELALDNWAAVLNAPRPAPEPEPEPEPDAHPQAESPVSLVSAPLQLTVKNGSATHARGSGLPALQLPGAAIESVGCVDPAEVPALIGDGATVIDVRSSEERADGFIAGSVHIPSEQWSRYHSSAPTAAPPCKWRQGTKYIHIHSAWRAAAGLQVAYGCRCLACAEGAGR
jgi:rhodanese-related sulfurtransferase